MEYINKPDIKVEEMTRDELIKEIRSWYVPGHGPDCKNETDDELKRLLNIMRDSFNKLFSEGNDDPENDMI